MNFNVPSVLTYVLAWFGVMAGIWALFERAELVLEEDLLKRLSNWLRNDTSHTDMQRWPIIFCEIFDRIFGKNHLSFKCFFRSCIASLCAVSILTLILTGPTGLDLDLDGFELKDFVEVLSLVCMVNLIPDYLSLLETRIVLGYMKAFRLVGCLFALLIDVVATALIFYLGSCVYAISLMEFDCTDILSLSFFKDILGYILDIAMFWQDKELSIFAIPIYSTFFTSIWIWLFCLSSVVIKGISLTGVSIRWAGKFFDIDKKPLRSLGLIGMIIVTIFFAIIPFISITAKKDTAKTITTPISDTTDIR